MARGKGRLGGNRPIVTVLTVVVSHNNFCRYICDCDLRMSFDYTDEIVFDEHLNSRNAIFLSKYIQVAGKGGIFLVHP